MLRVRVPEGKGMTLKFRGVTRDPRGDQEIEHEVPNPQQVWVFPKRGGNPGCLKSVNSIRIGV